MTVNEKSAAWAMLYLTVITPAYILRHPRETLSNWRNGRTERP